MFLRGCHLVVNTKIHLHYYSGTIYLACEVCLAIWHIYDISIVMWHLNNIIYQEHGVAQRLAKSCLFLDKHRPILTLFWCYEMQRFNWTQVLSFFLFLLWISAYLTGQPLSKSGCLSLLCGGEGLQWDTGLFVSSLNLFFKLNVSWHPSFRECNG